MQKIFDIQLENEQRRHMSQNNYAIAKQRLDEKKKVQDALSLQKKEEAKQSKMVKEQNEQRKRQNMFRLEQENKMKNQIGLQSKRLAQMKIEEERRRKRQQAQREHLQRCQEEEHLRQLKMDEVSQMEKLEMELIKRLQNTQAIQKEAYLELEKALGQPSAMLNTNALKDNINASQPGAGDSG